MVLLSLGLYTVTLNIIPLLMEKGAGYATAALGLGLVGAGQVGGRLLFARHSGRVPAWPASPGPAPVRSFPSPSSPVRRGC